MIGTAKKKKNKKEKEHGGSLYRPKEWKTSSTLRHWPKEAGMNPPGDEAPGTGHEGSYLSWQRRAGPSGTAARPCSWQTWWQQQGEGRAWLEAQGRSRRHCQACAGGSPEAGQRWERAGSAQHQRNTRGTPGKAGTVCSQMAAEPPLQGRADQPHKGPSTHPKRSHSTDRSFWSARTWLKEFDSHNTHISYFLTLNSFWKFSKTKPCHTHTGATTVSRAPKIRPDRQSGTPLTFPVPRATTMATTLQCQNAITWQSLLKSWPWPHLRRI